MQPYYSKEVIDHFVHPRHFGEIKNASGLGKVGNPRCGDIMKLYIKVEKKGNREIIKDIKFHTLGCAAAIATSDMVCDLVKGKTLDKALEVGYQDIVNELGELPAVKIHCSVLAHHGLKAAVDDYNNKKVAIVAHKAPQLALDVLLKNKTWEQAFVEDWRKRKAWQPGWEYNLE